MESEAPLAYRPTEVARLLGCSREMVFKLLERGDLKGYRIGAARFVRRAEIERFIADREAQG